MLNAIQPAPATALVERIRSAFPEVEVRFIDTVCQPTKERQSAARRLAQRCDVVIVVGGRNSNNTRQLVRACEAEGACAYQVEAAADLRPEWIAGCRRVGVTAGASAPEVLVQEVVERLKALGVASVRQLEGITERVVFTLPRELARR